MAELAIRKTNGGQPRQGEQRPMNLLREMMKWDPFSELAPVLGLQPGEGVVASFDVKETPNAYIFKADIPGFTEKDLDITTAGNRLTISGNRRDEREDKGDTYYVCERRYGSFSRAFTLPQGIDLEHVNAEVKHGVLTVTVPRVAAPAAKKIQVKSASVKA
jgi:HSP20 family protein